MRARYYEVSSGRFISEDPSHDGQNWFIYCRNNPTTYFDETGKDTTGDIFRMIALGGLTVALLAIASLAMAIALAETPQELLGALSGCVIVLAAVSSLSDLNSAFDKHGVGVNDGLSILSSFPIAVLFGSALSKAIASIAIDAPIVSAESKTLAGPAVAGIFAYTCMCWVAAVDADNS